MDYKKENLDNENLPDTIHSFDFKDSSAWDSFSSKVIKLGEERVDIKSIKKILKIKEKIFPSNQFMMKYFKLDFSK
jgi:hypothetical protein